MTRILVVDDEVALVGLVRSYLEREQCEVISACRLVPGTMRPSKGLNAPLPFVQAA